MNPIMKCPSCLGYTMKENCKKCDIKTVPAKPPKFSPFDKYAKYRREALAEQRKASGLI